MADPISVRVAADPIDPLGLIEAVRTDVDGAVILFLGTVRNHHDGREVVEIRYEAYEAMAGDELRRIAAEILEETGVSAIALVHRTGRLEIGEASIGVAVASPHRAEAYDASRRVMEEVKARVPVWKDEGYADGTRAWVRGTEPPTAASVAREAE